MSKINLAEELGKPVLVSVPPKIGLCNIKKNISI